MEAQVNALIILAVALVAVGLLVTLVLWLRTPHSAESEYVTVAELRARLENEQEPTEEEVTEEPGADQPETGGTGAGPEPADEAGHSAAAVGTPPTSPDAEPEVRTAADSTPDTGGAEAGTSGRPAEKPGAQPPPGTEEPGGPALKSKGEQPPEAADEPPTEKPGPDH
ncbi:hypothetical protein [Nocardia grenadensis]|uniref:hypothetical protein n=1 Tax=Nocardia grenadensis TaxID=931537 RepID=UPI0007A457F1|nr:hypothetical protein [Nocardia grenadensis]